MSNCCSDRIEKGKEEKGEVEVEKMPKSFVGKYLYKLGKQEAKISKQKKSDCC